MLRLENIQSEILMGYQRSPKDPMPRAAIYLLLRFPDAHAARRLLAALLDEVTFCSEWKKDVSLNLALGYSILHQLLPNETAWNRSAPFVKGMWSRADELADFGDGAPDKWEFSDGERNHVDAVVMIQGAEAGAVEARAQSVASRAAEWKIEIREQRARRLAEGRENFGFVDGISQPALEGVAGPVEGHGVVTEDGGWRKLKPGELVIGYDDEEGPYDGPALLADGCFIALRKLEQNVRGFHDYVAAQAKEMHQAPDWVAARIVGRNQNGEPLIPVAPDASNNDFRYAADSVGYHCPHGSHIRRANPRDVLNRIGDRAERHRMARRGLMYAERDGRPVHEADDLPAIARPGFPEGDDETIDRGMIFIAFNADLERQFEFVQGNWLNMGGTARDRLFMFRDPLTGSNDAQGYFVIPGAPFRVCSALPRFVRPRGGGYFFLPSRTLLRRLADSKKIETATEAAPAPTAARAPEARASNFAGVLAFSGWRLGRKPAMPKQAVAPEERLLLALAPIRHEARDTLARELQDIRYRAELDGLLASIATGKEPLVHHARFEIVDNFWQWPEPGKGEERKSVSLFNGKAGYLLFACWADGPRSALVDALARATHGRPFPLERCYHFPTRDSSLLRAARARAFFTLHGLPAAFSYEGYPSPTSTVLKALRIRKSFFQVIKRTQSEPGQTIVALADFFRNNAGDL